MLLIKRRWTREYSKQNEHRPASDDSVRPNSAFESSNVWILWVSSSFRIRLEFDSAERSEWNRGLMFDEWNAEGRKRRKKNNKTEGIPRIFLLFYYTSSLPLLIRLIRAVYINLKQWAFHKSQCIVSKPPQAITTMMTIKSPFFRRSDSGAREKARWERDQTAHDV